MTEPGPTPAKPSFRTALGFWWRLGWISFGGPTGQIAIMHEELVVRKKWVREDAFIHALNFCMMLPGPEAQQLATFPGLAFARHAGRPLRGPALYPARRFRALDA